MELGVFHTGCPKFWSAFYVLLCEEEKKLDFGNCSRFIDKKNKWKAACDQRERLGGSIKK